MFQRFVFNLKGGYRREMLEGRPHLVVNAAMLGESVVPGSEGPIFYPKEENAKNPQVWNGMPLVVYHPKMNGKFVSARQPEIYNERKVGVILNTVHDDKLRTEAWFDEERTKSVDHRVHYAVINNQQMEVSTGLSLELDREPGEHNGTKYIGKAKNYQPDHLAVLPDQVGAYSVAMGGGLYANESSVVFATNERLTQVEITNLPLSDFADPEVREFPIVNQEDVERASTLLHRSTNPSFVKKRIHSLAKQKGLKVPESWTVNELSFDDIECSLSKLLSSTYGEKGTYWNGWITDVFQGYVVFYNTGKMWKQSYTSDPSVSLSGTPVEVVRTTDYQPVNKLSGTNEDDPVFDKKAHIATLIGNGWVEADRAELEKIPDAVLQKIKPTIAIPAPAPVVPPVPVLAPVVNATPVLTLQAFLAGVPTEVRNQVERGLKMENDRKQQLITLIVGNGQNQVFTPEFLGGKTLEELEGWATVIQAQRPAVPTNPNPGMFMNNYNPQPGMPMYAGAQGATMPFAANQQQPLDADPPVMPDLFPVAKK